MKENEAKLKICPLMNGNMCKGSECMFWICQYNDDGYCEIPIRIPYSISIDKE